MMTEFSGAATVDGGTRRTINRSPIVIYVGFSRSQTGKNSAIDGFAYR